MSKKLLQIQQLNSKMQAFRGPAKAGMPPTGWIKAIRAAIGMSLKQMGNKLSITKQSMQDIEKREKEGTITLNALKDAAAALDMQLVYGFMPKDGTLEKMIDRKARDLAAHIVLRTSNTMKLEDQGNSDTRIKKAIDEKAATFKTELPKLLWD